MFKLPDLPYAYDALQPAMSAETLRLHHDKHHAAYVKTTNELVEKEGLKPASLEELVVQAGNADKTKLFNNAAQAWNHAFFWNCMTPGGSKPTGDLEQAIAQAFGGLDQLKQAFVAEGAAHFASGWVWIVAEGEALKVISTHDAGNTLERPGTVPILGCDVWEHAYYVDYCNERDKYLAAVIGQRLTWDFAARNFEE